MRNKSQTRVNVLFRYNAKLRASVPNLSLIAVLTTGPEGRSVVGLRVLSSYLFPSPLYAPRSEASCPVLAHLIGLHSSPRGARDGRGSGW
jgi:hypothetical protein